VLHARIIEALEGLYQDRLAEQVERLAHHALRGEIWDKAVAYCQQAGTRAMARSAYREAVVSFEQALGALERLPERRDRLAQAIDLRFDLRTALRPLDEQARTFNHLCAAEALGRGRDAGYPAPPAQIPACGTTAPGSCLGSTCSHPQVPAVRG